MAPSGNNSLLISIIIAALIAWRLYARVRRSIMRQRLTPARPAITIAVYLLLLALLLMSPLVRAQACWLIVPILFGVGLGLYGLRSTRFEVTESGVFYTPSLHLGIALSALLIARIAWVYGARAFGPQGQPGAPATVTPTSESSASQNGRKRAAADVF